MRSDRIRLARLLPSLVLGVLACGDEPAGSEDEVGSETSESGTSETESGSSATGESTSETETADPSEDTSDDTGDETSEDSGPEPLACNGHVELCERPLDEVVFAGTHNSFSATGEGFSVFNANQVDGVAQQLDDGVRQLMLDTYYEGDAIVLCHGPCNLGQTAHLDVLADIVAFLSANPGEIVVIIYQDDVAAEDLALDYAATGADALTYAHPDGGAWPTLGELVEADTRLIVTAEAGGPPPAWHHHVWDLAWDTPYGPSDPDELSCELNRGSPDNDLFLLNHWVNNELGLPSVADAEVVNQYEFLLARAQECWEFWDHPPNFVAVDYYDRGDLVAVVDTLNGF